MCKCKLFSMKLYHVVSALALLKIFLTVKAQNTTENEINPAAIGTAVQVISTSLCFLPPPYGIMLSMVTSSAYQIYYSMEQIKNADQQGLSTIYYNIHSRVEQLSNNMKLQFEKISLELPNLIHDDGTVQRMRKTILYLQVVASQKNIKCLSENCPDEVRIPILNEMTNRLSTFRVELTTFIDTYISSNSLRQFDYVTKRKSNIFDIILKNHELEVDKNWYCAYNDSAQTRVFHLIEFIFTTIVQSYTIILSSYIYKISKNGTYLDSLAGWENEASLTIQEFRSNIIEFVKESQQISLKISRDVYNCNPEIPKRGETYERLTHFLQAQIYARAPGDECLDKNYIKSWQDNIVDWDTEKIVRNKRCSIPSHMNQFWTEPADSERIYHHLAYCETEASGFLWLDTQETCVNYGDPNGMNLQKSRIFPLTCQLVCNIVDYQDPIKGLRRISLDFISASPGYVVTGIQWVVKNNIVQLELHEGLLVNGSVQPETLRILSAPEDSESFLFLDYKTRSLRFDEILFSAEYFITGIGLIFKNNMITLRAKATKVNNDLMTLSNETIFADPLNDSNEMTKIHLDDDYPPEIAPLESKFNVRSSPGKNYVEFGPTSFEKDAAQTTIPYFDTQIVQPNTLFPLNGIEMFYKGIEGYGGYIAFKIITMNLMPLLLEENFISYFNTTELELRKLIRKNIRIQKNKDKRKINRNKK